MGKASRDKGKRGEREVVDLFKAHGFTAHRSAQVDGTMSCDVVTSIPALHVEVKRYAKIGAMRFMDQAVRDAKAAGPWMTILGADPDGKSFPRLPILFMREDEGPWRVMVDADLFFEMVKETWH